MILPVMIGCSNQVPNFIFPQIKVFANSINPNVKKPALITEEST
jgi:hypothetical protein